MAPASTSSQPKLNSLPQSHSKFSPRLSLHYPQPRPIINETRPEMPAPTAANPPTMLPLHTLSGAKVETPETYAAENSTQFTAFTASSTGFKKRKVHFDMGPGVNNHMNGTQVDSHEEMGRDENTANPALFAAGTIRSSTNARLKNLKKRKPKLNAAVQTRVGGMEVDVDEIRDDEGSMRYDAVDDDESDIIQSIVYDMQEDVDDASTFIAERDEEFARALAEQDELEELLYVRGLRFEKIARAREERDGAVDKARAAEFMQQQELQANEQGEENYVNIPLLDLPDSDAEAPAFVAGLRAKGWEEGKISRVMETMGMGWAMGISQLAQNGVQVGNKGRKKDALVDGWVDGEVDVDALERSEVWKEYQRWMDRQAALNW